MQYCLVLIRSKTHSLNLVLFSQSKHIKLASPQAAWLSIFFVRKPVMLHLFEGPELRTHYRDDREEKKSPAPGRIRTHDLFATRRVLYPCPATAAPRFDTWIFLGVHKCNSYQLLLQKIHAFKLPSSLISIASEFLSCSIHSAMPPRRLKNLLSGNFFHVRQFQHKRSSQGGV